MIPLTDEGCLKSVLLDVITTNISFSQDVLRIWASRIAAKVGKWENGKTGTSLSADSVRSCTAVPGSSAHARAQPGSSPVLDARLGIELRDGLARLRVELIAEAPTVSTNRQIPNRHFSTRCL